jgi:hypothetical protein
VFVCVCVCVLCVVIVGCCHALYDGQRQRGSRCTATKHVTCDPMLGEWDLVELDHYFLLSWHAPSIEMSGGTPDACRKHAECLPVSHIARGVINSGAAPGKWCGSNVVGEFLVCSCSLRIPHKLVLGSFGCSSGILLSCVLSCVSFLPSECSEVRSLCSACYNVVSHACASFRAKYIRPSPDMMLVGVTC